MQHVFGAFTTQLDPTLSGLKCLSTNICRASKFFSAVVGMDISKQSQHQAILPKYCPRDAHSQDRFGWLRRRYVRTIGPVHQDPVPDVVVPVPVGQLPSLPALELATTCTSTHRRYTCFIFRLRLSHEYFYLVRANLVLHFEVPSMVRVLHDDARLSEAVKLHDPPWRWHPRKCTNSENSIPRVLNLFPTHQIAVEQH